MQPTQFTSETWKPVAGWELSYEVSNLGRVRSVDRTITRSDGRSQRRRGKILTNTLNNAGYCVVRLSDKERRKMVPVHRLVALTFLGSAPEGQEVCHNNGNSQDNRVENLRWDTRSENASDAVIHGTHPHSTKTHCPRGHEYSTDNTYIYKGRYRQCRACKEIARAEHRKKVSSRG